MKIMRFGHIHIIFIFISYYFHIFCHSYFICFSYFREFLIEAFCVAHASYNGYLGAYTERGIIFLHWIFGTGV